MVTNFTLLVNYITDSTSNEEQYEAVEFFVDAGLNYARRNNIVMPNSYVVVVTGINMCDAPSSNIRVMQANTRSQA